MNNITTTVEVITSETAKKYLEYNINNRTMKESNINGLMRDMKAGDWVFDGSPIRFSKAGRLIDGQHRLTALANMPGHAYEFLVVRGLEDESQIVMDQGAKRSGGDQLRFLGYKNHTALSAFIRLKLVIERGLFFTSGSRWREITSAAITDEANSHPELEEWLNKRLPSLRKMPVQVSTGAVAWWLCFVVDESLADEYFTGLATGAGLEVNSPTLTIRNYMNNIKSDRVQFSTRQTLEILFRGFNKLREGKSLRSINLRNYGESNFPFPK